MRKISSFMLLAVILFSACNNPSFKKGKDGLEYKIISSGSGAKIQYGNYMQLNFATFYNTGTKDSLLNDSRTSRSTTGGGKPRPYAVQAARSRSLFRPVHKKAVAEPRFSYRFPV